LKPRFALAVAVTLGALGSGTALAQGDAPPLPDAERARAYAQWQYQYQQYQYAMWLAAQQRQAPPPRRWYGWQTLVSDGLSITVFTVGIVVANESRRSGEEIGVGMGVAGFLGFVGIPPIIHLSHAKGSNAGISAGIRLGATALLFLGALECANSHGNCEGGAALGVAGFLGYPVAVVVDAVISHEDVAPGEEARLRIAPWAGAVRGGGALGGVRGAF
jgi:hypothetical protein